jgi:hypothetical protein
MVVAGVADSTRWDAIAEVFRQSEHASPWMEKFVLESLFRMGRLEQALDGCGGASEDDRSLLSTLWDLAARTGEDHATAATTTRWAGGPLVLPPNT